MVLKDINSYSLGPLMLYYLGENMVFDDVIKLRILKWRGYPGLSILALYVTYPYKRETERDLVHAYRRGVNVKTEARSELYGHESRNAGSHQKLEEARNRFSPRASQGSAT